MKKILFIGLCLGYSLVGACQNAISELSKSLIFHAPLSQWQPDVDLVSGTASTNTDTYNVLSKDGGGRRWLSMNGTSNYVSLPVISAFGTSDFSIIRRVGVGSVGATRTLIGGSTNCFELNISPTGYLTAVKFGGSSLTASTQLLSSGVVYSLGYSRSGTTGTYWVNGVASGTCTDTNDYTVASTLVGNGTGYFNGDDYMTRVFNYSLTPTQIANYSKPEYPIEWVDRGATGAELITDADAREFISDSGWWTRLGTISISGGTANWNNESALTQMYRSSFVSDDKYYNISYQIMSISGGAINCYLGSDFVNTGTSRSTTGVYHERLKRNASGNLSFYSVGTTTASIDHVYVQQAGCVLDLNAEGLSQSTSGYWYDKTNSLTATNSGTSLVIPPASNLGAMAFNGTTSKIEFPPNQSILSCTKGSISFSMFPLSIATTVPFSMSDISATEFIFFELESNGKMDIFCYDGGSSAWTLETAAIFSINNNYNITLVHNGIEPKLYVNNVLVSQSFTASSAKNKWFSDLVGLDKITIGAVQYGGAAASNYYLGTINDVLINNEPLDTDRIKLLNDIQ